MKKSQKKARIHDFAVLAALLIAATTAIPALAHEDQAEPFTMAVIINESHGSKVTAGKYEQAIERITQSGRRSPKLFADQVNLCVAYTKSNETQKASIACEAAIARVKKQESRVSRIRNDRDVEVRTYRANLALALSNRGVLMAATGYSKLAKQDFLAAIELQTQLTAMVESNLERLTRITRS